MLIVQQEEEENNLLEVESASSKTILQREYQRKGTSVFCEWCFSLRRRCGKIGNLCRGALATIVFTSSGGIGFAGMILTSDALEGSASLSSSTSEYHNKVELYLALQLMALLGSVQIVSAVLGMVGTSSLQFQGALRLAIWLIFPESVLALAVSFEGTFRADALRSQAKRYSIYLRSSKRIEFDARAASLIAAFALLFDLIFRRPAAEAYVLYIPYFFVTLLSLLDVQEDAAELEMQSSSDTTGSRESR
uniref:Uncharacterized protein n=1 Tax=Aureoumbra lagunensis TaxID=44058 RepID=A0A7S3K256_9STRA